METTARSTNKDRIKLPFQFDVKKMQAEIKTFSDSRFIYYKVLPIRSPAHLVDTSLPFPPPADDYADGSWCDWLDTPILKNMPYISEVVDTFKAHTQVTLVRLLFLEAGAVVKEHTDPTLGLHIEKSVIRLTIPIFRSNQVQFILNQTPVPMQEGECWYMRLTDPHSVINEGVSTRINMTIDMIPNDWVWSLIESGIVQKK